MPCTHVERPVAAGTKNVTVKGAMFACARIAVNLLAFPVVDDLRRSDDWELIDDVI